MEQDIMPAGPEVSEPEVSTEFMEQLQGSGSTPCALHGMDHLSHDPTCEHCKRALGPMYRHLKGKYGPQIADHTPTLSFDFRTSSCGGHWCSIFNGLRVETTGSAPDLGICPGSSY